MAADGVQHPATFSKPALRADCVGFYNAFMLLSASRLVTVAATAAGPVVQPQRIQLTEIKAYLDTVGETDPERRERFMKLMVDLDDVELRFRQ